VLDFRLHWGRKDHCLLDQHFEQIVEYQRSWSADDLLFSGRIQSTLGYRSTEHLLAQSHHFLAEQERQRRVDLNALVLFLVHRELIDPKSSHSIGAATKGSIFGFFLHAHMMIHLIVPSACLHMVPRANIEHCSSIEDFTSATYNHETFYDMCSWATLLARYLPHTGGSNNNNTPATTAATTILQKSTVVRNVMSQLKAAVMQNEEVEFASLRYILQDDGVNGSTSSANSNTSSSVASGNFPEKKDRSAAAAASAAAEEDEDTLENDLKYLNEYAQQIVREKLMPKKAAVTAAAESPEDKSMLKSELQQQQPRRTIRLQRVASHDSAYAVAEVSVADVGENLLSYQQNTGASLADSSSDNMMSETSSSSLFPLPLDIRVAAAETVMALCGRAIVTDLIHCRISEYVVRAEPTWLQIGMLEQTVPRAPSLPVPPRVSLSCRPELEPRPWVDQKPQQQQQQQE
jgi:hypothetical protein